MDKVGSGYCVLVLIDRVSTSVENALKPCQECFDPYDEGLDLRVELCDVLGQGGSDDVFDVEYVIEMRILDKVWWCEHDALSRAD